jgi:predicted secreted protein
MRNTYILSIIIVLSLTSCFTEETPMVPHEPGNVETGIAALRDNYRYQVFYNLATNTTVKTNIITDWDLGFEASDTGWRVILNTSRFMQAAKSGIVVFEDVISEEGLIMKFDRSDGNPDSTAVGNWFTVTGEDTLYSGFVYVIDMGYDENFDHLGYKKVIFQKLENNTYTIRTADLNGANEQTAVIEKDATKNYVCFSFVNGIMDIEPDKTNWTLLFTKYSTLVQSLDGGWYPYSVLGVQLNPYSVEVCLDTLKAFEDLVLSDTLNYEFSSQRDYIGYEWKYYDFEAGVYTIVHQKQ